MSYCDNCGREQSGLFCESCGAISASNIPNSFSNDEALAGMLANVINQGKSISISELLTLTKSQERSFRIFSQLEKTNNFFISESTNDYTISKKDSLKLHPKSSLILKETNRLIIIKSLLELFPLSFDEISYLKKFLGDTLEIIKLLETNKNYKIDNNLKNVQKRI